MEFRVYDFVVLSVLTVIAIEKVHGTSEPTKREAPLDEPNRLSDGIHSIYSELPEDYDSFNKRRSLMRFGKRRSIMRFGKRGSIMRFGKRSSLMRFGKRGDFDSDEISDFVPAEMYDYGNDYRSADGLRNYNSGPYLEAVKRPSLLRFGRSSSRARSNAHTPWRFGREESELEA